MWHNIKFPLHNHLLIMLITAVISYAIQEEYKGCRDKVGQGCNVCLRTNLELFSEFCFPKPVLDMFLSFINQSYEYLYIWSICFYICQTIFVIQLIRIIKSKIFLKQAFPWKVRNTTRGCLVTKSSTIMTIISTA